MEPPTNRPRARSVRIVLLGFGAINRRVAELIQLRDSGASIVGIVVRHPESLAADVRAAVKIITSASDLIATAPTMVIEAASREAVVEWGESALRAARRFVVSSTSALVDDDLLLKLRETARAHASQLVLSPGALGGVEALSAASRLPLHELRHRIVKSPSSWATTTDLNAPPAHAIDPVILFSGSAREAARRWPLNANVTVVSALASVGLDRAIVELVADPSAVTNRHEIHATGEFGTLTMTVDNRPLHRNPKSSELAALALVRLVENEIAEIVL